MSLKPKIRPQHRWSEVQLKIVEECTQKGLYAGDIIRLDIPELTNLSKCAIQRCIVSHRWVDPIRSERLRNGHRLSPNEKEKLISFLQNKGKNLPDSVVAKRFGIGETSVHWFRIKVIGKSAGPRRIHRDTEKERRKKISQHGVELRQKLYRDLCALQLKYEKEGRTEKIVSCVVCGARRFQTADFFYHTGNGRGFFRTCRVCVGEISVLKKLGLPKDQFKRKMFGIMPRKTDDDLKKLLAYHHRTQDKKLLMSQCEHCRSFWPMNWQYFHHVFRENGMYLSRVCLACPAERRFNAKK